MKHTCIIGGGGFIGRSLVKELAAMGRQLTVIGRNPVSPFGDSVTYLFNGHNDPAFLRNAFAGVDEVIELAYSSTPKTSFDDPVKDIFENLAFSVKVFEALLQSGVRKIVCVSSGGTIYGQSLQLPVREDHPTNPVSPYGITKLAIEKYGNMFHAAHGLPIVFVRPGNAYGEGQLPFRGQGFIPTAIGTFLKGEKVNIFGAEGTIRDYIYIDDLVSGIVAALEHGANGECYNIGTGEGKTNLEIIKILEPMVKAAGYTCAYELLPARSFDVKANVLDAAKLKAAGGWQPLTDIETGLRKTFGWLLQHKSLFLPVPAGAPGMKS